MVVLRYAGLTIILGLSALLFLLFLWVILALLVPSISVITLLEFIWGDFEPGAGFKM